MPEVFDQQILERLPGHLAIGHVRYSTTGSTLLVNAQPFVVQHGGRTLAIGHNGNLTNAREVRCRLEEGGSIFQSSMDTEIIVHLMARHRGADMVDSLINALEHLKGSYSLVLATADQVIAARDPHGFRPLCLGQLNGSWMAASETCALDLVQADYLREVEPGEIVVMDAAGLHCHKPFAPAPPQRCIFEFIYFARPDSQIFGKSVYQVRKRLGAALAREHPLQGDLVMPFPDSGTYAALGYAAATGIPFRDGDDPQPLRGSHLHPALPDHAGLLGTGEAQPGQGAPQGPAGHRHRRLHHPGHHHPLPGQVAARGRGQGSEHAGELPAPPLPLLLRHRLFQQGGTHRRPAGDRARFGISWASITWGISAWRAWLPPPKWTSDTFCLSCFSGDYPIPLEAAFSKTCFEEDVCAPGPWEGRPVVCESGVTQGHKF